MVLQRRLDYGFNGYQVPVVPRASRSPRGRGPIKKKHEENQIHAFEILASVAGKLLLESESSAPANAACGKDQRVVKNAVKWEEVDEEQLLKTDPCVQETSNDKAFVCVPRLQGHHRSHDLNEFSHAQDKFNNGSISKDFDHSEKICFAENLATVDCRNACISASSKVGGDSPCSREFFEGQVEDVIGRKLEAEPSMIRSNKSGSLPIKGSSDDTMKLVMKTPALVSSKSNIKASLCSDCTTIGPFSRHRANIKVVSRDDDENFVGCTRPSIMMKACRPSNVVDRKIKKTSASRHWRVAPNLKSGGYFKTGYNDGRTCYARQRSQRIYPFKKRRFFNRSPLSTSDRGFCCEATGSSSSSASQQVPPESRDCNVKLSIKSFKVPELFIEIPATATVGSLKRTVMEAVTAILGDGLHVGVLLQGKKVRDDSKTLRQTGISQDEKHHSLGFMLEPRHAQITPPPCTKDPPLLSGGTPQGLTRHTASLTRQPRTSNVSHVPPAIKGSCVESDIDAVPSLADMSIDNSMQDSRAIVTVPAIRMEALAVVPFCQKSAHPEFAHRRIRRPFSVSEVEALVEAVEKLGTGRWRDVKLCAFDGAKHRTYVDLKDKWKTLVHTARISRQQRRGEPVPQELLDRVLAAHAYWSQQQAKQQVKSAV